MILYLQTLQRGLLALKILGLRLGALERAIQGVERRVDAGLRTLNPRRSNHAIAGIELLKLLRESLKCVRKPFLIVDQISEIREQILVGLPDSRATAARILNRVLKLLSEVRNGGGLLLKLLELTGEHLRVEDDLSAASELGERWPTDKAWSLKDGRLCGRLHPEEYQKLKVQHAGISPKVKLPPTVEVRFDCWMSANMNIMAMFSQPLATKGVSACLLAVR